MSTTHCTTQHIIYYYTNMLFDTISCVVLSCMLNAVALFELVLGPSLLLSSTINSLSFGFRRASISSVLPQEELCLLNGSRVCVNSCLFRCGLYTGQDSEESHSVWPSYIHVSVMKRSAYMYMLVDTWSQLSFQLHMDYVLLKTCLLTCSSTA